jgi:hypothetical protein
MWNAFTCLFRHCYQYHTIHSIKVVSRFEIKLNQVNINCSTYLF